MSGHGDAHAEHDEAHEEHDDHGHHVEEAPAEPETPLWLTILGAGLFLAVGIAYMATQSGGDDASESAPAKTAASAAASAAAPAPAE